MPPKKSSLDQFESQMAELESLVKALEAGDAPLEETVKSFEKGMQLSKNCETLLKEAELRVEKLSQSADGEEALEQFSEDVSQ